MTIKLDLHYVEPRLVDLYDIENPLDIDSDFYLQLADDLGAKTIVDLGCGTGLLTRALATHGRTVYGVDPAPAMLAFARKQPGADRVTWIDGDAQKIGHPNADLAIMTGNVAQIFLEENDWMATLQGFYNGLRPGGTLAFESRNPKARAWEGWIREETFTQMDTMHGPLDCWLELIEVGQDRVKFRGINVFTDTDETLVVDSELRFRTAAEISQSLQDVGFLPPKIYGGWQKEPLTEQSRPMVFVTQRPE